MINPNNINNLTFWRINNKNCTEQEELIIGTLGLYIQPRCFENINDFIINIKKSGNDAMQIFKHLVNKGAIEFSKYINWDEWN